MATENYKLKKYNYFYSKLLFSSNDFQSFIQRTLLFKDFQLRGSRFRTEQYALME